jgi:heme/copper-type cytochrome/quinol oxidase subunit 3
LIVLFILMTTATFGGPLAISVVLRGGRSPDWPPDRAVEWVTLAGTSTLVIALIAITIAASLAIQRKDNRARATRNSNDAARSPREAERGP